mgnify:CR=1 FL=1
MKRLTLLLLPILFIISGCQEVVYPNQTIIADIAPSSWRSANGGRSFYTIVDMPEITDNFNARGGILTYLAFESRTYEQLPQVYNGISYTWISRPGEVVIEIENSDGLGTVTPPSVMITAKIILVESDY